MRFRVPVETTSRGILAVWMGNPWDVVRESGGGGEVDAVVVRLHRLVMLDEGVVVGVLDCEGERAAFCRVTKCWDSSTLISEEHP